MSAAVSPITLMTQINLPAGAGELGVADPTRLENPFQSPMWLDEVRFHIPQVEGQSIRYSQLYVKLFLGTTPLTHGSIPMSLLCKQLNDSFVPDVNLAFSAQPPPNVFTWKLPKPLFIPAREYLRPVIYYAPSPVSSIPLTQLTVSIIYSVRPLPRGTPTPKTLQVPWVTAYVPPVLNTFDAGDDDVFDVTDQSTPADIFNPWDQDLHVQRFVGRFLNYQIGDSGTADNNLYGDLQGVMNFADELVDFSQSGSSPPLAGTFVSAQDSFNNILIRDPTPFYHAFDFLDRSWTVNCILPPKGFYLFTVDRLWQYIASELDVSAFAATVGISMIGWREVQYI